MSLPEASNKVQFRYEITSKKVFFAVCDVCQREVRGEVFIQQEVKRSVYKIRRRKGWTIKECPRLVGHIDCLISRRKNG